MSTMFEEEIGWILNRFKDGELNHYEAMLEIENLVSKCLGFAAYNNRLINHLPTTIDKRKEPNT